MDTNNFQQRYPVLLDFLTRTGYKKDALWLSKKVIRFVLTDGNNQGINSYEDFFQYEVPVLLWLRFE